MNSPMSTDIPARGKIQDLRDELRNAGDRRDKAFQRKKTTALKKIVANMTMGNDSESTAPSIELTAVSPLFPEIIQAMQIQVLEIKKSELAWSRLN